MLAIGERFDRYTIEALLGHGGMGEVYRAFDPRLERRVALKVLHAGGAVAGTKESAGHAARLIREARAAAALDHPNVVAIFDVGEVDDTTFLAMELIEGRTLRSYIGEGVAIATRLGWLIDIAATLAFAHSRGFVHRDIKPENIMVRADGVLKVLDFGIARRARALPTAATLPADRSRASRGAGDGGSTFAGTPHYMAPEQMQGLASDGRVDQFAWGVVAYELLSGGAMPWPDATDLVALVAKVIGSDPVPLPAVPGLPAQLSAVVMRTLRRAPEERFAAMDEVLAAIQQTEVGTSAPGTSLRGVARRAEAFAETVTGPVQPGLTARRGRRAVLVATVVAAVVAAATAYVVLREDSAPVTAAGATTGPRRSVAVIGFRNLSGREDVAWIATALVEMMTTELAIGEQLRTVTVDDVERMKRELAIGETDGLGQAELASVGRRLGTELVVTGSYLVIGEKIRLDLRLVDITTGEPLVSVSESDRETELIDLVARAGASLRRSLRADELSAEQAGGLRASVPATPEAARLYATGLARLRAFDATAARLALERVTTLEPGFALGHAALADALAILGMDEAAVAASERAMALSQPLRREERLKIELRHHVARRAWEPAIVVARNLHELFPDDLDHGLALAAVQASADRPGDTLATTAALRRLPPPLGDDPRIDLAEADAYSQLGDAAAVERVAAAALAKAERVGATTIAVRARILLASRLLHVGDNEGCIEQLEQLRASAAALGEPALRIELLNNLMIANIQLDELARAAALGEEMVRAATALGNRETTADVQVSLATILFRLGRLDDAERALALGTLASPLNQIGGQVLRGQIAAVRGDLPAAGIAYDASVERLREVGDLRMVAWVQALRGEVALVEDRLDEAEALGRESLATREGLGLAQQVPESKLLLARVALARGQFAEAAATASEAAEGHATARARSDEAEARAWLVLTLLGARREVAVPLARAQALAATTQRPQARLRVALVAAVVAGSRGDHDEARRGLTEVIAEATRLGLEALVFEARLAAARVDLAAGRTSEGRAALTALIADVEGRGWIGLTREARAAAR